MTLNVVLPFVQGVSTSILFVLVLRQRKVSAESGHFAAFLASMSLWGFLIAIMRGASDLEFALYWEKAALVMIASTTVTFYLFTGSYTGFKTKPLIALAVVFLALAVIAAPTSLFVERIGTDRFGNAPEWGPLFYPLIFMVYVFIIASLVNLARARRGSSEYEVRNRYTYLILGTGICVAGGLVDLLSAAGVPVYPGSIVANVIFALLTSLAILQYHLFDIQVMVRSSVAYLLTGVIVAVPIAAVAAAWAIVAVEWALPLWMIVSPFSLFVFAIPPVWGRVEPLVMKQVRREKYAYLRAIEEFRRTRVNINEVGELCSWIVDMVVTSVQPESTYLFVQNGAAYSVGARSVQGEETVSAPDLSVRHPLVNWLVLKRELLWRRQLDIAPELQAMSQADREILTHLGAELYCPISTGVLTGILALGRKTRGRIYSREDLEFLATISREVALELENVRLYAQERATRQELQHQNDQKTEFLHHVAHELKTPLTAIISSSEMMVPDDIVNIPPEHRRRLVANINRGAWLMDRKVSELLDLARVQIGRVELNPEAVDVRRMIDESISQLSALFKNKEQSIEVECGEPLPPVRADRSRTTEVLMNLLSNANKFSRSGGVITVKARAVGDTARIEVKDSASTIGEADRARIFDAYYRGGTAEDQQRVTGLGLGLAISRSLIAMQQGEIGVSVGNNGSGNTFYFTLPLWTG